MFQTPAAGGNCSGDGSAAGSGPVDVVGTGAGGEGAAVIGGFGVGGLSSPRRAILRTYIKDSDSSNRPYACGET